MGYLHIDNLYKNQTVLGLEEVYALEKIHGTSANVSFKNGKVVFFSGGEKYENFKALFNEEFLNTAMASLGIDEIIVNGEAYGGKQQGMKKTYGPDLKFIVFDVRFNGVWLTVPAAKQVADFLKMEFVHYVQISTKLEEIDRERDADSVQAIRNGMGEGHKREGVVLRPCEELYDERGNRLIAKHKRAEFIETKTPREVNPDKQLVLKEAQAIAEEWVTPMRLHHVLDVLKVYKQVKANEKGEGCLVKELTPVGMEDMKELIGMMIEDVKREAKGEIEENRDAMKAIGRRTAILFKKFLEDSLKETANERS